MAYVATLVLLAVAFCGAGTVVAAGDDQAASRPIWEPLLWGGKILDQEPSQAHRKDSPSGATTADSGPSQRGSDDVRTLEHRGTGPVDNEVISTSTLGVPASLEAPAFASSPAESVIPSPIPEITRTYYRAPFRVLSLKSIPPLYTSPVLPGEGIWQWKTMPTSENGWPIVYATSYRPSVEYPNAIVHMLLFDMKQLSMKLFVGSAEPGASKGSSTIDPELNHKLIAVTNALWKQRHSGDAGTVYRGKVLKELAPGVATLVVYADGSVDILEWNETIPLSLVQDAKQLRHLIVKDGKVVTSIVKGGQVTDSEIGLGYLLAEEQPGYGQPTWGGYYWRPQPMHTSGAEWFIASRSAFGIRSDGNLVFAVGHHISTKDLAKALALAGCQRAIHGDANPHNVLGNLYYSDGNGGFVKKAKLSPDQTSGSVNRYVGRSYTSDFFGFFLKHPGKDST